MMNHKIVLLPQLLSQPQLPPNRLNITRHLQKVFDCRQLAAAIVVAATVVVSASAEQQQEYQDEEQNPIIAAKHSATVSKHTSCTSRKILLLAFKFNAIVCRRQKFCYHFCKKYGIMKLLVNTSGSAVRTYKFICLIMWYNDFKQPK